MEHLLSAVVSANTEHWGVSNTKGLSSGSLHSGGADQQQINTSKYVSTRHILFRWIRSGAGEWLTGWRECCFIQMILEDDVREEIWYIHEARVFHAACQRHNHTCTALILLISVLLAPFSESGTLWKKGWQKKEKRDDNYSSLGLQFQMWPKGCLHVSTSPSQKGSWNTPGSLQEQCLE